MTVLKDIYLCAISCSQLSIASNQEQDLRDGNTNPLAMFYVTFDLSLKFIMMNIFNLSWTMTLFAWYYNPYWFMGIQLSNILLYYCGTYLPSVAKDGSKGLNFGNYTNASQAEVKKQAQTSFIFALVGLFGLDQLIKHIAPNAIKSIEDWLFTPQKPSENAAPTLQDFKSTLKKLFHRQTTFSNRLSILARPMLSTLRRFFLAALNIYEHISWAMYQTGLGKTALPLLQHGALIALHSVAINAGYKFFWMAETLTVSSYAILLISSISLLNYYQLLAPRIRDYLFKFNSISHLLMCLIVSDLRQWVASISTGVSMLTMLSSRAGELLLHATASIGSVKLKNNLIYQLSCMLIDNVKKLIGYLFGAKTKESLDRFLDLLANMLFNLEGNYRKWSDMLVNWKHESNDSVTKNAFQLTKTDGETACPTERFIEAVWKPHLNEFLKMPELYMHTNPLAAKMPDGVFVKTSPNLLGFNDKDRQLKFTYNGKTLGHGLQWNLEKFRNVNTQKRTATWWQRIRSFFQMKQESNTDEVCKFFIKHVNSREAKQLCNFDAQSAYDAIFTDSTKQLSNLKKFISEKYESAITKTQTLSSRDILNNYWDNTWAMLQQKVQVYDKTSDKDLKADTRTTIVDCVLTVLENLEKCSAGFIPALQEIIRNHKDSHGISATEAHYRAQMLQSENQSSQKLAAQLKNQQFIEMYAKLTNRCGVGVSAIGAESTDQHAIHAPRTFDDSEDITAMCSISPETVLYQNLLQQSDFANKIEANNRHLDNLCRALHGIDTERCYFSAIERDQMGILLPFAKAFNLIKINRTKPFGHQCRDSFANKESDNLVLPPSFFESDTGVAGGKFPESLFYKELQKMLTTAGYLSTQDTEEHKNEKLYQLLSAQLDIAHSPIRFLAIARHLKHIIGTTITWRNIAEITHLLDHPPAPELAQKPLYYYLERVGFSRFTRSDIEDSDYLTDTWEAFTNDMQMDQQLKSCCEEYLKNPFKVQQELKGYVQELDDHAQQNDLDSSVHKSRCFSHRDNPRPIRRYLDMMPLEYLNHNMQTLEEPGIHDIQLDNISLTEKEPVTLESYRHRTGLFFFTEGKQHVDDLTNSCIDYLHNQIVMPFTLTLLLKAGIIYRGAEANDDVRDAIYPNVAAVLAAKTPTPQKSKTLWENICDGLKTLASAVKFTVTDLLPVITVESTKLSMETLKHAFLLSTAIISTAGYYLPRGLILKYQHYIYAPMMKALHQQFNDVRARLTVLKQDPSTVKANTLPQNAAADKKLAQASSRWTLFGSQKPRDPSNKSTHPNSTTWNTLTHLFQNPFAWTR